MTICTKCKESFRDEDMKKLHGKIYARRVIMMKRINVIASIQTKEGRRSEFVDIFKSNVPNVIEEKGCIDYVSTIDVPTGLPPQKLNRNVVTIIEKWESLKDLQAHLTAPHMLAYQEKVKDLVENVSLKILEEV
jgi:quinol monooxygenase YgiN